MVVAGANLVPATIAGLIGTYISNNKNDTTTPQTQFYYTVAVAAISMFLALLWLIPFAWSLVHYPTDTLILILWVIVYILMVNFIKPLDCGSIWDWSDITKGGTCQKWKAAIAFTFLSAVFWLITTIIVCAYDEDLAIQRLTNVGSILRACPQIESGVRQLFVPAFSHPL